MRLHDDAPQNPEIAASLDAIDATLAGEPVDPAHAAFAELALLLSDERPEPSPEFGRALDERVARRFAPVQSAGAKPRRRGSRWLWTPAAGLAGALAIAVVIVLGGSAGPGSSSGSGSSNEFSPTGHRTVFGTSGRARASAPKAAASGAVAAPAQTTSASGSVAEPLPSGRRVIQGAQLSLSANPRRIDDVAQELFVVVGQVHGIVSTSTITATGAPGAYAQFQLSIPSASMPQAMAALSSLQYASVASRTDTTQDVNDQYQADVAKLADDRAIRASLLRQLAAASTQGQIDSLTIRIHDIAAAISSDQTNLQVLDNQVNYSQVSVTINGGPTPVPVRSGGSGFGLHRAVHDAGRVLTVAAGVVLIGLAALAPVALLLALGWWIAVAIRRRRRQQALDLV